MPNLISIVPAEAKYAEPIKQMLKNEKLPTEDIPADLDHFYMATNNGFPVGSIGLEIYGEYGFLRSIVVKPEYRKMMIAGELVKKLEANATRLGLKAVYLLTESASAYFERKGYKVVKRDEMPAALKQSSEFTHTCPQSAIAMFKEL